MVSEIATLGHFGCLIEHVAVEHVDQNVENAAGHHPGYCTRPYRPPGWGATRPSSSRISNIEATDSPEIPVRSASASMLAGSKPSASNRISYSLSNAEAALV